MPRRASLDAIAEADAILLAPSNPYLSIGPILAVARGPRRRSSADACRCVAVSPLVGGAAVTGPAARMLTRMAGGATPAHVADRYEGLIDALVIDERDAPATAPVELVVDADADATTARPSGASREARAGGSMRVAVVGGTGPFGKALAVRLHASGIDVIVGSRDAERAAATALELDCVGETNVEASSRMRTSSSSPSTPKPRSTRPASFGTRSGRHPCLSVASELRFTKQGVLPSPDALSLAERVQAELAGPVVAGLHSLAASSLGADDPPDEDALRLR